MNLIDCEYYNVKTSAAIGERMKRSPQEIDAANTNLKSTGVQIRVLEKVQAPANAASAPNTELNEQGEQKPPQKKTRTSRKKKDPKQSDEAPAEVEAAAAPPQPEAVESKVDWETAPVNPEAAADFMEQMANLDEPETATLDEQNEQDALAFLDDIDASQMGE